MSNATLTPPLPTQLRELTPHHNRLVRWRPVLRMARRAAIGNKLRSILILALLALPVGALSTAVITGASKPLSPAQKADRILGTADAQVTLSAPGPLQQTPTGNTYWTDSEGAIGEIGEDLAARFAAPLKAQLPTATVGETWQSTTLLKTSHGALTTSVSVAPIDDAQFRPALSMIAGSWPTGPDDARVVLTDALASRLNTRVGEKIVLRGSDHTLTVSGIGHNPFSASDEQAWLNSRGAAAAGITSQFPQALLISHAAHLTWNNVLALNKVGLLVQSREMMLHPPARALVPYYSNPDADQAQDSTDRVAPVVAGGLAVLQLVLLAGPAFAISARRRQRELAQLAAAGGGSRDLRRAVLAEALVLGGAGALGGLALGFIVSFVLRSRGADAIGPLRIPFVHLTGIAVLGLVTALLSAAIPAHRAGRLNVVAALSGTRPDGGRPWRTGILGLLAGGIGIALGLYGATQADATPIMIGIALTQVGLLSLTPALLVTVARLGPRLPLSTRIAVRDAARNRTVAVPALAAVLAATTAGIGIAIYVTSIAAHERLEYQPQMPDGGVSVQNSLNLRDIDTARSVLAGLPALDHQSVVSAVGCLPTSVDAPYAPYASVAQPPDCSYAVVRAERNMCPQVLTVQQASAAGEPVPTYQSDLKDPRCQIMYPDGLLGGQIAVIDASSLSLLTGRSDPGAEAALARGRTLLTNRLDLDGDVVHLGNVNSVGDASNATSGPAQIIEGFTSGATAIMTAATAAALHLPTYQSVVVGHLSRPLTDAESEAATARADDAAVALDVEAGYVDSHEQEILICLVASALVATLASALATGLAVVDSRPDLVSLWAIGAPDHIRRRLAMARAGMVAGLGALLGTALGFLPAAIMLHARNVDLSQWTSPGSPMIRYSMVIPWWPNVIGTALAVPLVAVGVAAVMTWRRSEYRLPTTD